MTDVKYVTHDGRAIGLNGPASYVGVGTGLRSRAWAYELGFRELTSIRRTAREIELELAAPYAEADAFRRLTESDMAAGAPGTFTVDGWSQRAFVTASEPQIIGPGDVVTTLNAVLLDGAWWRLKETQFTEPPAGGLGGYLDYPYDLPTDYGRTPAPDTVESATLTPSPVRIIVYGPAVNPYVIVGGNTYQVDVTVPSGARLEVDGRESTITLISSRGVRTDHFADGVRATGEGGGSYIFEPLQPGPQAVTWDGSFPFTFGWYELEGGVPWKPLG